MASVTSLDQDMRKLRLDRYTPQAANEIRSWIESALGEQLAPGDLLDSLKDGVALCKLANLVLPAPGIKYKPSAMPFVQRENISHFLTACERPPLKMPSHDRFLTVDLYDNKDGAQVIQCLSAFSRAANAINPTRFPQVIGPKRATPMSPTRRTANGGLLGEDYTRNRGASNASQGSESTAARTMSPGLTEGSNSSRATGMGSGNAGSYVSSWSRKSDEGTTAPAWNIHQYGYMGGASQGNQGVTFGARRQIVSPDVNVPSLAEKEKRRKEQEAEEEQRRMDERQHRAERDAEEEQERLTEEDLRQEESKKAREKERQELEQQRQKWEEEERRWKEEEEQRRLEEEQEAHDISAPSKPAMQDKSRRVTETERIRELERQLEEAKERERQYQLERAGRSERKQIQEPEDLQDVVADSQGAVEEHQDEESEDVAEETKNVVEEPKDVAEEPKNVVEELQDVVENPFSEAPNETMEESDFEGERQALQQERQQRPQTQLGPPPKPTPPPKPKRRNDIDSFRTFPQPSNPPAPSAFSRLDLQQLPPSPKAGPTSPLPRPLPDPTPYFSTATASNRTDRFLTSNPPPVPAKPKSYFPSEIGMTSTSERAAEDARRVQSQARTKAGGWASKGLLEREMEKERERQKEWEEAQVQRAQGTARSGGLLGPRELKR